VSFAAITLCVASQRVFVVAVYFVMTQSGNVWIHPRPENKIQSTPNHTGCNSRSVELTDYEFDDRGWPQQG
jgi:hypothetical protein